jgi:cell wall-associated NlpC family hydrolase
MSEATAEAPTTPGEVDVDTGGGSSSGRGGSRVRVVPGTGAQSGPRVKTPLGEAPVIPLLLAGFGAYLLWFGVKYWRGEGPAVWPSYPIKSVLQGHGLPPPQPAPSSSDQVTAYESTLGAQIAAQEAAVTTSPGGGTVAGSSIAADASKYVGQVRYVWGGANPSHGWDCSGMVNWVCGHDLALAIPGLARGTQFDGSNHGPDVAQWIAWSGVAHVAGPPQPGDLVAWGPNGHIGVAVDASNMVSALNPAQGTQRTPIAVTHVGPPTYLRLRATGGSPASGGSAQNTAKLMLGNFGLSLGEFPQLIDLWNRESSWSRTAWNPSGAYGIAQALGHAGPGECATGPRSVGSNTPGTNCSYGGFGLSSAEARAANGGSMVPQIKWGLGYIRAQYHSIAAAWSHEQQFGWY